MWFEVTKSHWLSLLAAWGHIPLYTLVWMLKRPKTFYRVRASCQAFLYCCGSERAFKFCVFASHQFVFNLNDLHGILAQKLTTAVTTIFSFSSVINSCSLQSAGTEQSSNYCFCCHIGLISKLVQLKKPISFAKFQGPSKAANIEKDSAGYNIIVVAERQKVE